MSEATVPVRDRGSVAIITLNRPQALNSFTRQMHRDLWSAFDRIDGDKAVRARCSRVRAAASAPAPTWRSSTFEPDPTS
jgi:2-(1,2-epoxy-1,2-dihydrophenyl)acetyl-CoA isomerase